MPISLSNDVKLNIHAYAVAGLDNAAKLIKSGDNNMKDRHVTAELLEIRNVR